MASITFLINGDATSPRNWSSQNFANVDEAVASADGATIASAATTENRGVSLDTSFTLQDTGSNFGTMNTLSYNVRYRANSNVGDDTLTFGIRIVSGATILAAADSGGTFQTVRTGANTTWVTTLTDTGNTAFTYVNTTADKTTWDAAQIEFRSTHSQNMGPEDNFVIVDSLNLVGDYNIGPVVTRNHTQARASVKARLNRFHQAQGRIKRVYSVFIQARTTIKATTARFTQAQAQILPADKNNFTQAQASIKAIINRFVQAQGIIRVTQNYPLQAQTAIKSVGFRSVQSLGTIKRTYNVFTQSQGIILTSYVRPTQAQAYINLPGTLLYFTDSPADTHLGTNNAKLNSTTTGWLPLALLNTRGDSVVSVDTPTVAGTTNGVETQPSGGVPREWISPPVDRQVTISGNIEFNLRAAESNAAANVAINCVIEKISSDTRNLTQIIKTSRTTEVGTSESANNFVEAPPVGITVNKGDRLRVRVFGDDAGTMASGHTFTFWFDGSEGSSGDSWINFTEDFFFMQEPSGTTLYLTDNVPLGWPTYSDTGWLSPGTITSVSRGQTPWSDTGEVVNSDDVYATSSPVAGRTDYLVVSNFGIDIPEGAVVRGFELEIEVKATSAITLYTRPVIGATAAGIASYFISNITTSDDVYVVGGLDQDLHLDAGTSVYENPNLGFRIFSDTVSTYTMSVDRVRLRVFYNEQGRYNEKEMGTSRGDSTTPATVIRDFALTNQWNIPVQYRQAQFIALTEWYSKPLTEFILAGQINAVLWALQENAASYLSVLAEVAITDSDGSNATVWGTALISCETDASGQLKDTLSEVYIYVGGPDTLVESGQRLRLRLFMDDAATNPQAGNWYTTVGYDRSTAAAGDSYLVLPQSVSEYVPVNTNHFQAQAKINSFSQNKFAQAQASTRQIYQSYAQTLATISAVTSFNNSLQAQGTIKAVYSNHLQAQSTTLRVYETFYQAQALIVYVINNYVQSNAYIKATNQNKHVQVLGTVKASTINTAQAQAKIGNISLVWVQDSFTRNLVDSAGTPDIGPAYLLPTYPAGSGRLTIDGEKAVHDHSGAVLAESPIAANNFDISIDYRPTEEEGGFSPSPNLYFAARIHYADVPDTYPWDYDGDAEVRFTSSVIFPITYGVPANIGVAGIDVSNPAFTNISINFVQNQWYTVKARYWNETIYAKAWIRGEPEPTEWQFSHVPSHVRPAVGGSVAWEMGGRGNVDNFLVTEIINTRAYQAQAYIQTVDNNNHAQAQGTVLQSYNNYTQAQAIIASGSIVHVQAQGTVLAEYQNFAQAQGIILQSYINSCQAQASILAELQNFTQAQGTILATDDKFAQAQGIIKDTYNNFVQAQGTVLQTYAHSLQAQGTILTEYQQFAQAQAKINSFDQNNHTQALSNIAFEGAVNCTQAQAKLNAFGVNQYVQAQGTILQAYQSFVQSQGSILAEYPNFTQAQGIIRTEESNYSQAQSAIKQVYNNHTQAQTTILASYQNFTQAQGTVLTSYNNRLQAQGLILTSYQIFVQTQGIIRDEYESFVQAQGLIKQVYNNFVQAQGTVLAAYNEHVQAQGTILTTYDYYVQAQGTVLQSYNNFLQAQGTVLTEYVNHSQVQAIITDTYDNFTQAQAIVLQSYTNFVQAQSTIKAEYLEFAQAQAKLNAFEQNNHVQSLANIAFEGSVNHAQAQARINAFGVMWFVQAQAIVLAEHQNFVQAQGTILQTYNRFVQAQGIIREEKQRFVQAQGTILQYYQSFVQAAAGVLATYNNHVQAQGTILTDYQNFTQAQGVVLTSYQHFVQAQASILTTYNNHYQAQGTIKSAVNDHLQTLGTILQTYLNFSQAQALIGQRYNSHVQAQGTILAVVQNFMQAQGIITDTYNNFTQAQANIVINIQIYQNFTQAQGTIKSEVYNHLQTQGIILTTYNNHVQSQGIITVTNNYFAQAQAHIIDTYSNNAQAQGTVKAIVNNHYQAQGTIQQLYNNLAQSQGTIKTTYLNSIQAQASIGVSATKHVQTQGAVKTTYFEYVQAQGTVKTEYINTAQAQAFMIKPTHVAQAQAYIRVVFILKRLVISDRNSINLSLSDKESEHEINLLLSDQGINLTLSDNNY